MKTDALVYQLFKAEPDALCRLMQLDTNTTYTFHSITLKATERRLDGFLESADGRQPNIFFEFQGYKDNSVFWRGLLQLALYRKLHPEDSRPALLVFLFLDAAHAPDEEVPFSLKGDKIIYANLKDCLAALEREPGPWTVLKPLVLEDVAQLSEAAQQWRAEIDALDLPIPKKRAMIELLMCAATERFSDLTLKEITEMLHLTPLDQTRAGREILQRGVRQGAKRGLKKGLEKGLEQQIRMISVLIEQRFGPLTPSTREKLSQATRQDVENWIPKLLNAKTVEEIFLQKQYTVSNK